MNLYAPTIYWRLTTEQKSNICNGCGAKGGTNVPDSLVGVSINEACNIHDYMFSIGKTKGDFLFSNAMFMMNMTSLILSQSNWVMTVLRMSYASKYFLAVAMYGEKAYWVGKKKSESFQVTYTGMFEKDK